MSQTHSSTPESVWPQFASSHIKFVHDLRKKYPLMDCVHEFGWDFPKINMELSSYALLETLGKERYPTLLPSKRFIRVLSDSKQFEWSLVSLPELWIAINAPSYLEGSNKAILREAEELKLSWGTPLPEKVRALFDVTDGHLILGRETDREQHVTASTLQDALPKSWLMPTAKFIEQFTYGRFLYRNHRSSRVHGLRRNASGWDIAEGEEPYYMRMDEDSGLVIPFSFVITTIQKLIDSFEANSSGP